MSQPAEVLVLAGGLSHEREVSLHSGHRVAQALRGAGLDVEERDVDASLIATLRDRPPLCVLPLLHGGAGEDGAVREVLELLGTPYVGSRPAASRVSFDKPVAKTTAAAAGVSTPGAVALPHEMFRELGSAAVLDAVVARLGLPLVVKPTRGGSALGCSVVRAAEDLPAAMIACFGYGPVALVERFVTGTEVAVTVLDFGSGPAALPAVEIRPASGSYDYAARYTAGATEFVVPASLAPDVSARCAEVAVRAHRALQLRDVSRSDLIVDAAGQAWWLEANVAPGMTETSLVPLAIAAAGLDLGEAMSRLVDTAVTRAGRSRGSAG